MKETVRRQLVLRVEWHYYFWLCFLDRKDSTYMINRVLKHGELCAVSPSSSCSCPQLAGSWYTVPHTERSSDCCGLNCSPALLTEPETGYSCMQFVKLPALTASAHKSNMGPGKRKQRNYTFIHLPYNGFGTGAARVVQWLVVSTVAAQQEGSWFKLYITEVCHGTMIA